MNGCGTGRALPLGEPQPKEQHERAQNIHDEHEPRPHRRPRLHAPSVEAPRPHPAPGWQRQRVQVRERPTLLRQLTGDWPRARKNRWVHGDSKTTQDDECEDIRTVPQAVTRETPAKPARKRANRGGPGRFETESETPSSEALPPLSGIAESALAEALRAASVAKRWDVVAQLAEELQARRRAREGDGGGADVVSIADAVREVCER